MKTSSAIDWFAFTNKTGSPKTGYITPDFLKLHKSSPDTPRFGYLHAVVFDVGTVIHYHGSTPTMGQHYIYNGKTIAALMDAGVSPVDILVWHTERGHTCTRLDLAVDVRNSESFLQDIADATFTGDYTGNARSANIVHSPTDGGMTIYMGSRQSEKFVRIYDKGVETGQGGLWTRCEVELKGDTARRVAKTIFDGRNGDVSQVAQSVIQTVCKFKTDGWLLAFNGLPIDIEQPQPKEPDTEKWLLTQVVSAIAKFERQHPDRQILRRMAEAVDDMLSGE